MRRSDDELRNLWQDATREGRVAPDADCPTAEELAAALDGRAPAADRERIADHLVACAACAAAAREHGGLREWSNEAAGTGGGSAEGGGENRSAAAVGGGSGGAPGRGRRWALLAAGLAAVALAVYVLWQVALAPLPPATGGGDVQRGGGAGVHPAGGAVLVAPPQRFTWPAEPGATGYRVRLYDERAELLWTSPTTPEPGLTLSPGTLPPGTMATLAGGGTFSWSVDVLGPARRGELGPYWFRTGAGP